MRFRPSDVVEGIFGRVLTRATAKDLISSLALFDPTIRVIVSPFLAIGPPSVCWFLRIDSSKDGMKPKLCISPACL
ncbi:hypothetical protein SCP_0804890 [Sparassis crispa]|uniref:Uncharacterized protein n=1 Tax=Sparassis crispa TaxID=139825 RepID=A0A401GUQ6_9APHY|nr:hypothetical protein SCP_0804890 [Sparassis crispa]GBE85965.1 hypothetical protein SCP_0804890 [Sparassis crispa]